VLTTGLLFVAGLVLLVRGADLAVRNAAELALYYGVSSFFVGVTVVAVGTSVPEMTTSVYAAYYGAGDLVVGNIVGSETAQITLVVGLVALVSPLVADRRNVMVYGGAMVLAMIIMILTLEDGRIVRSEGFLMMLSYVNFVYILYTNEGGEEVTEEATEGAQSPRRTVPWVLLGLAAVVIGGQVLVTNGVALATQLGLPELLIGLLTGLGTSVPELVVATLAARSGDSGISVGSLLGSNITDPVFSLGVGALVADVVVTDLSLVTTATTYMLVAAVLILVLLYWRRGLDRRGALVALALYVPSFFVV
jgi:cation:H+ antiporter